MRTQPARIVLLGAGGVGKSCLTLVHCHNQFVDQYDPTIEDTFHKQTTVDGTVFDCEIIDSAGVEQFTSLHSLYIKSGDAFLLVFSLAQLESVNELDSIRQQIVRTKELDGIQPKDVPIVLVGNKCDLVSERQVPRDVGVTLSNLWNSVPYYETSAAKGVNVSEIFQDALLQILRKAPARRSRSSGKSASSSAKRPGRCAIL